MVQRLPEGNNANSSPEFYVGTTTNIPNQSLDGSHITNIVTPDTESDSNAPNQVLPNGHKAQSTKGEWVVQDEPGVYISLSSLPGGGHELKRVRFRYLCLLSSINAISNLTELL